MPFPALLRSADPRVSGLAASFAAYLCWGFLPLYWRMLSAAGSVEVIAHRIVWTVVVLALFFTLTGRMGELRRALGALRRRPALFGLVAMAAATAATNWWIHVYAVQAGRVMELGIGMFLTPLLSVLLGCLVFGERFTRLRLAAFLFAAAGVAILAGGYGRTPWVAVGVSTTWAAYGAFKKRITFSAWTSNAIESGLLAGFALAWLIHLALAGESSFGPEAPGLSLALAGTGVVTLIPMVAFAYAARALPLYLLGFCQFLNPILTVLVGCFILKEPYNPAYTMPLAAIGVAVALFVASETAEWRRR